MRCCAAAMFIAYPAKSLGPDTDLLGMFHRLTPGEARLTCARA